jgi:hypothetical protein
MIRLHWTAIELGLPAYKHAEEEMSLAGCLASQTAYSTRLNLFSRVNEGQGIPDKWVLHHDRFVLLVLPTFLE